MNLDQLVTIVIPCRNEQDYIGYLLRDLSEQAGIQGVRIIIADKSEDDTPAIIRQYQKNTPLNIEVVEGGPVSIAKNRGADLVYTPYTLFIDSDVRFFSNTVIQDTVMAMEARELDLIGLRAKCYDGSIRAALGFKLFNFVNSIMSRWLPFAVGAYMLTRTSKFHELGRFPCKYATSEDFMLSKMYDVEKFMIYPHYYGQDSRRFQKMGYLNMTIYLIRNFLNRNNPDFWEKRDYSGYWD
jgi:glycosyltransferase involved in cell wall biosynthesis